MQVSFTSALEGGRANLTIGRVKATGPWRAAEEPAGEADRGTVIRALALEAEDQGADALVDVRFEADETAEIDGVSLRRLVATGSAVRAALAA
jgi:uncharacterized protein YbjQ (UPF0145 family)